MNTTETTTEIKLTMKPYDMSNLPLDIFMIAIPALVIIGLYVKYVTLAG